METEGTAARYFVRIKEMRESVKILSQALKGIQEDPMNLEAKRMIEGKSLSGTI